jgi:hypothetical protein
VEQVLRHWVDFAVDFLTISFDPVSIAIAQYRHRPRMGGTDDIVSYPHPFASEKDKQQDKDNNHAKGKDKRDTRDDKQHRKEPHKKPWYS